MRIGLLGPLQIHHDRGRPDVGGRRVRALLILLALDCGRVVSADSLIAGLWDADPPAGARGALQSLVSRLRAALVSAGVDRDVIESRATGYRLALPPDAVDANRFESLATAGRRALAAGDPVEAARLLRDALSLWHGPALADAAGAGFAAGPAARLEELRRTAAADLVDASLALGCGQELTGELQAAVVADPLAERPRAQLMRVLAAAGRQADALAVYEEGRRLLAEELGVDPSPQLREVHLAVLRQDLADARPAHAAPARPARVAGTDETQHDPERLPRTARDRSAELSAVPAARVPPARVPPAQGGAGPSRRSSGPSSQGPAEVRSAEAPSVLPDAAAHEVPTTLRASVTSFVGRDEDVARIGKLLGEGRLVTVTGPGGAGKTRLALASAAELAGRMPDGVWLVELAPLCDPAEVAHAALAALGIRDGALLARAGRGERGDPVDPVARLVTALSDKQSLLVLDNCEHLIDAVAVLTDRVLAGCPRMRVLTTSREALAITGEQLWPARPLPFPDEGVGPGEAVTYPAVRLFADRAAAVLPGFEVDTANVRAVVGICRGLDGLPLAIELAAARLRTLPAQQIAARLDDRFGLLSRGSRTALPRHQTLRAVVEWSWDLLSGQEQVLLRRLSVFSGGVRLGAAERVCAGDGLAAGSVLDAMAGLVEKSLVTMTGDTAGSGVTQARYRMLDTVRAYGLERLAEAGERDRLRRDHARYYLGLAETAEPRLRTADQLAWMDLLVAEHDDIHGALLWTLDEGDAPMALRFGGALAWYWYLRGLRAEGVRFSRDILALSARADAARASQTGRAVSGSGAVPGGGTVPAGGASSASHDGVGQVGLTQARALCTLIAAGPQWQFDLLGEPLRLALAEADATGVAAHPVLRVAEPALALQDGPEENAVALLPRLFAADEPWVRAAAGVLFAGIALNQGRYEEAARASEEAIAAFRALGERWGLAMALMTLAEQAGTRGDHDGAIAALEDAAAVSSPLAVGEDRTHLYGQLASERMRSGDYEGARGDLAEARRVADRVGEKNPFLSVIEAELARREGNVARARALGDRALIEIGTIPAGFRHAHAIVRANVAAAAIHEGDTERVRGLLAEALRFAVASGDRPCTALVVETIAGLALLDGDPQRAATLLGAGHGLRGSPDPGSFDVPRFTSAARQALGGVAYSAAYERGRAMPREAAFALAQGLA